MSFFFVKALELGRDATVVELYKRLKVGRDGGFLDADGENLMNQLEEVHGTFLTEHPDVTHIDHATSTRLSEPILGTSSRSGLPKVIGSAASLATGTEWSYQSVLHIGSQRTSQDAFNKFKEEFFTHLSQTQDSFLDRVKEHVQRDVTNIAVAEARAVVRDEVRSVWRETMRGAFSEPDSGPAHRRGYGDDADDLNED